MRIRLVQESMRNYSGHLGDIYFENGVSVDHVAPAQAHRMAVIMPIETLNGEDPSMLNMMHELHYASSENVGDVIRGRMKELEGDDKHHEEAPVVAKSAEPVESAQLYQRETLEDIADKEGIAGLRKLGDAHEIKGRSISELIEELLQVQA
ncbi:MAG: hypothetical protein ABJG42_24155 [Vibrio splendidus]